MTASNSVLYSLYLDIKRGLLNKRFWSVLGIYSIIFLIHIILTSIYPLTCYYLGGKGYIFKLLPARPYVTQLAITELSSLEFLKNFFPFIGPLAYAYTVMDDRRQGYYVQQVQRMGFSRYYWCKLAAGSLLGGLLAALLMVGICTLSLLFIEYNPFFREAVEYYSQYDNYCPPLRIGWGYGEQNALITVANRWVWWFIGGIKYFLLGTLYGLIASVIAFFTDNKVLMFAVPIIFFIMEDKWLWVIMELFGYSSSVSTILGKFTMRSEMGYFSYGNLYHWALVVLLIVLFINLAKHLRNSAECSYMEGGDGSD